MNRSIVTGVFAGSMLVSSTASGLTARTFVATTGNDAAVCSLAAPCRSFAAALAQTATGGEIVVLDSGGYGSVAISKAVSIIAPKGVYGGITAYPASPNAAGITVYDARVVLRGLSINGQGGDFGIYVFGDAVVHIEDCTVSNLDQYGVRISGVLGSPEVFIEGSAIRDNGSHGVYANGAARVHVSRSSIRSNGGHGLLAVDGPLVNVSSSVVSANSNNGVVAASDAAASATLLAVSDSTLARNAVGIVGSVTGANAIAGVRVARNTLMGNGYGVATVSSGGEVIAIVSDNLVTDSQVAAVSATGTGVKLTASNNSISGNSTGFNQTSSAVFRTRGNNTVQDNGTDVLGTTSPVAGD
jgi:hypothetical protein